MARMDRYQQEAFDLVESLLGGAPETVKVFAGAGSGKTYTLARMLEAAARNRSVVGLSFTGDAGKELKGRVLKLNRRCPATIGTAHSLAGRMLRGRDQRRWDMSRCLSLKRRAPGLPSEATIWSSIVAWNRDGVPGLSAKCMSLKLPTGMSWKDYALAAGKVYGAGIDDLGGLEAQRYIKDFEETLPQFGKAFGLFQRSTKAVGGWTFDQQLHTAMVLLATGKGPRPDAVFGDEWQDSNATQQRFAALLASQGLLVLIGDARQSIYSFRGASVEGFVRTKGRKVELRSNYRSGTRIVHASNAMCRGQAWAEGSPAVAARSSKGIVRDWIDGDIEVALAGEVLADVRAGRKLEKDIAILCRSNGEATTYEIALRAAGLRVNRLGAPPFLELPLPKAFLAWCVLAEEDNLAALSDAANAPYKRYLGHAFIPAVRAQEDADDLLAALDAVAKLRQRGAGDLAADLRKIRRLQTWSTKVSAISAMFAKELPLSADGPRRQLAAIAGAASRLDGASAVWDLIEAPTRVSDDGVVVSTVHRCVSPTTWVEGPWGLAQIAGIPAEGFIATAEGTYAYRSKVEYEDRAMLRITTRRGYQVEVTEDHGMFTWSPADGEYVRVEAGELGEGSFLRLRLGETTAAAEKWPSLPPLPAGDLRARVPPAAPTRLGPNCAEFFGLMVADGTVYAKGFRLKKRHLDVVERFVELVEGLFGVKVDIYRSTDEDSWGADVNSTLIASWLLTVGGMAPKAKAIPGVVLKASRRTRASFLRGLYADGTVAMRSGDPKRVDSVSFSTAEPGVAELVQVMLLQLGVVSSRFPVKGSTDIRVVAYGQDAKLFGERVGFISAFKQNRLAKGEFSPANHQNAVPVQRADSRLPARDCATRRNARYRGYLSRATVQQLGGFEAELGFYHDRIAAVERYRGPAVCVEVPGAGRFLQNGFDGANSKGKEWGTVYVDAKKGSYVRQTDRPRDLAESGRLAYVAVTRAKDELVLVAPEPPFAPFFITALEG